MNGGMRLLKDERFKGKMARHVRVKILEVCNDTIRIIWLMVPAHASHAWLEPQSYAAFDWRAAF